MKFLILLPLLVLGIAKATILPSTPPKPAAVLEHSATVRIADARSQPTVRVAQAIPTRRVEQPQIKAEDVVKSVRTPVSTAATPIVVDAASLQATQALTTQGIPLSSATASTASASRYNGSAGCSGGSRGSSGYYYRSGLLGRLFRR